MHELAADRDDLIARARAWVAAHETAPQPYDAKGYRVPGGTPSTPSLAANLPAFPANLTKQLKGAPCPAPYAILSAAVESLQVDVDTAFTVEGRYFVDLVTGQISTNMIQALWFDLNRINGGGSRPDGPRAVHRATGRRARRRDDGRRHRARLRQGRASTSCSRTSAPRRPRRARRTSPRSSASRWRAAG